MGRRASFGWRGLIAALGLWPWSAQADQPMRVAAAAAMKPTLDAITVAYLAAHPQATAPDLIYGASGNLAQQIRRGAPFHLFLSADEAQIAWLHSHGLTHDAGAIYAEGRLALASCVGLSVAGGLDDLRASLVAGRLSRFAIANPDHAPYGQRAQQALQAAALWPEVQPHLVMGENISQAAQFVLSGNADMGIIAYSLALSAPFRRDVCQTQLLSADLAPPLRQRMAVIAPAQTDAQTPIQTGAMAFYTYLQGPEARKIFAHHGFGLPGD